MSLRKPDVVTVAVKQQGGGLTVMRVVVNQYAPDPENPGGRIILSHTEPTTERVDALIAKYVNDGHWNGDKAPVSWRFVDNEFLNEETDQTFRDAWEDKGNNKPDVNMPKAREIHKEKLRRLRASLLEDLDNQYMRADEAGDTQKKKEIADQKQILRDITDNPAIEAAQTTEDLKAITI